MPSDRAKRSIRGYLQKILLSTLGVCMVFNLFLHATPVYAVAGIADTSITVVAADIPWWVKWGQDFLLTVGETMGYKLLKNALVKLGEASAKSASSFILSGGKDKGPLWEQKTWNEVGKDASENAVGFMIDGIGAGIDVANTQKGYDDKQQALKDQGEYLDHLQKGTPPRTDAEITTKCTQGGVLDAKCVADENEGVAAYLTQEVAIEDSCNEFAGDDTKFEACRTKAIQAQIKENNASLDAFTTLENNKAEYSKFKKVNEAGGYSNAASQIISTLCNPSLSFRLKLMLAFARPPSPVKPLCSFTQFTTNWSNAAKSTGIADLVSGKTEGWDMLKGMIDPQGTDTMIAFNLSTNLFSEQTAAVESAGKDFNRNYLKPVTDVVGHVLTPSPIVEAQGKEALVTTPNLQTIRPVLTGKIQADLVDLAETFLTSFAGTMGDIIKEGLAKNTGENDYRGLGLQGGGGNSRIYSSQAGPDYSGQQAVQAVAAKFEALSSRRGAQGESFAVLGDLQQSSSCEANPNYCVIGEGLASAIQQKLTVREAIKEKLISEDQLFGFKRGENGISFWKDGGFRNGFPYESLVILRKYRVIPVGWEIAALYIKDHKNACGGMDCRLRDVLNGFAVPVSPFYRLVDENWVLKLPAVQCFKFGNGPASNDQHDETQICRDNNGPGGTPDDKLCCTNKMTDCGSVPLADLDSYDLVYPRTKVCIDERSCLSEKADGSCATASRDSYGYCLEERTKVALGGTECQSPQFASCLGYTDIEGKTQYLLKDTIPDHNVTSTNSSACNASVAGCRWLSARQYSSSTPDTQAWSSSTPDRIYLASSAEGLSCPTEQAGCTSLQVATTPSASSQAYRIAPPELECNTVDGYKKKECQGYALSCNASYAGCKSYTPSNGDPQVAGTNPSACDARCVGLTSYIEKRSTVEERMGDTSSAQYDSFVASSGAQCNQSGDGTEVGCEEFTDLQKEQQNGGSGEVPVSFSKLIACTVQSIPPDPKQTFYSWFGADKQGSRLVKYQYDYTETNNNPVPKCALDGKGSPIDCTCTVNAVDDRLNHDGRKGDCREFINVNGTAVSRWTDLLVVVSDASDCRTYRRTARMADGTQQTPTFSKSRSRSCPTSAIGCHEYHSPYSANQQTIISDTFDSKINLDWHDAGSPDDIADVSSDTETLNQSSLDVKSGTTWRLLPYVLEKTSTTTVEFVIKTATDATVSIGLQYTNDANAAAVTGGNLIPNTAGTSVSSLLAAGGVWTPMKFYISPSASGQQKLYIQSSSNVPFIIDRIIAKKTNGIIYLKRDSWATTDLQCRNTGAAAAQFGSIQYQCQEYADSTGAKATYQGFAQLCPIQLVGCREFADPNQKTVLIDDHFNGAAVTIPSPATANWTYGGNNTVAELKNDSSLKVTAVGASTSFPAFIQKTTQSNGEPLQVKAATGYTLSFRMKDSTNGSHPIKGVEPQLVLETGLVPLNFLEVRKEYKDNSGYPLWVSYTFTTTDLVLPGNPPTSPQNAFLRIIPKSTDRTDVTGGFGYEIDDVVLIENTAQQKLYIVDDAAKSCPAQFNGCTAYGLPNLDQAGGIKKVKKYISGSQREVEDWSILAYKMTAQRIHATAPGTSGVCSEAQLLCKEYRFNNGTGNNSKEYFQDPRGHLCYPVASAEKANTFEWKKKTCSTNPKIGCMKDSDCPNGENGSCANERACTNTDITDTLIGKNPDTEFWVQSCPQSQDTCRRISDPECGENTLARLECVSPSDCPLAGGYADACLGYKPAIMPVVEDLTADPPVIGVAGKPLVRGHCVLNNSPTLRNDYGRQTPNVACVKDYYRLADLAPLSSKECNGKVNVAGGCLLFHDDSLGAANTYDSAAYYENDRIDYLNPAHDPASGFPTPNKDTNVIFKVRRDRECKIALECTSYAKYSDGSIVCQKRTPCEIDPGTHLCRSPQRRPRTPFYLLTDAQRPFYDASLQEEFRAPVVSGALENWHLSFMSLTGLSRPNFDFGPAPTSSPSAARGGHDGYFDWKEIHLPAPSTDYALRVMDPIWGAPGDRNFYYEIINSCRAAPKQDTPGNRATAVALKGRTISSPLVPNATYNECSYDSQGTHYYGESGFCLEPNPKFSGQNNLREYRENSSQQPVRNYCLNWYPTDRTSVDAVGLDPFSMTPEEAGLTSKDLYYCLAKNDLPAVRDASVDAPWPQSSPTPPSTDVTSVTHYGPEVKRDGALAMLKHCIALPFIGFEFNDGGPSSLDSGCQNGTVFEQSDKRYLFAWRYGGSPGNTAHNHNDAPASDDELTINMDDPLDIRIGVIKSSSNDFGGQANETPMAIPYDGLPYLLANNAAKAAGVTQANAFSANCGAGVSFIAIEPRRLGLYLPANSILRGTGVESHLGKWHVRYCANYDGTGIPGWNNNDLKVVAFKVSVQSHKRYDFTRSSTQTGGGFCSDFIKLTDSANSGRAIFGGTRFTPLPVTLPNPLSTKIEIGTQTITTHIDYPDAYGGSASSHNPYNDRTTGHLVAGSCVANLCNGGGNLESQCKAGGTRQSCAAPPGVAEDAFTPGTSTHANQIEHASQYYKKPYEYWQWDDATGAKTYVKKAYIDETSAAPSGWTRHENCLYLTAAGAAYCTLLETPWNKARTEAVPPKIRKASGAENQFTVEGQSLQRTTGATVLYNTSSNKVELSFKISAPAQQLPIRYLGINWDSEGSPNNYEMYPGTENTIDGHGINPTSTIVMGHDYMESPDRKKICIKTIDNYAAWTEVCGTLELDSENNVTVPTFTNASGKNNPIVK